MITELEQLTPESTDNAFINCDCMEGMKKFPDKYFDLAIIDPPYGDWGGWIQVRDEVRREVRQVQDITHSEQERNIRPTRRGGTWAKKYGKKSFRGTLPRSRNILTNCFASHVTRLYGGATISYYRLQGVS